MKFLILAVCIVACAFASDKDAQTLRSSYDQSPEGNFQYSFEADNGIIGQAQGVVRDLGQGQQVLDVSGSNSYQSPEGETISLTYIANEDGYQPQGDHLPTPPPTQAIPDYILRSLEYIKAHPYVEPKQ